MAAGSVEDLRARVFDSLTRTGAVDNVKVGGSGKRVRVVGGAGTRAAAAQALLRSRVVAELRRGGGGGGGGGAPSPAPHSVRDAALRALVADFLRASGCEYTLSVFLPEAGVAPRGGLMSREDIAALLRLPPGAAAGAASLLEAAVARAGGGRGGGPGVVDAGAQTEEEAPGAATLTRRLAAVSGAYAAAIDDERRGGGGHGGGEERMVRYEREVDARAREELAAELARVRDVEIRKMRAGERARCQGARGVGGGGALFR